MGRSLRRAVWTAFAIVSIAGHGDAQSILTVAGGVVGDGRPATRASLLLPTDVELDASDNLYVADQEQHRVRRVDGRTGIITTVAGNGLSAFAGAGGPAIEASFKWPVGVAVDSAGNLYIASEENRVLRVDASSGILTLVAGTVEGQSGTIRVRLYEAGNRSSPIADKLFSIGAGQQISLETVFEGMDLDSPSRRKDRANVLLVVTPESGGAGIASTAVEFDNETGLPTAHVLRPLSGGLGGGNSQLLATPVIPSNTKDPGRQRPVSRPN